MLINQKEGAEDRGIHRGGYICKELKEKGTRLARVTGGFLEHTHDTRTS